MGLDLLIFDDSVEEKHRKAKHSENTGISFSIDEWGDFFDELDIPNLGSYVEGEDMVERDRKEKALFKAALSAFPMLSRIDEYYADAEYNSKEVHQLLNECNLILPRLTSPLAITFANGLIAGCKEAIKSNYGLVLVAD